MKRRVVIWVLGLLAVGAVCGVRSSCAAIGSVVGEIPSPGSGPTGVAWDGTHLWNADQAADRIYKLDPSDGSVVDSFSSPGGFPWGLAWDGVYLWCLDVNANRPRMMVTF